MNNSREDCHAATRIKISIAVTTCSNRNLICERLKGCSYSAPFEAPPGNCAAHGTLESLIYRETGWNKFLISKRGGARGRSQPQSDKHTAPVTQQVCHRALSPSIRTNPFAAARRQSAKSNLLSGRLRPHMTLYNVRRITQPLITTLSPAGAEKRCATHAHSG